MTPNLIRSTVSQPLSHLDNLDTKPFALGRVPDAKNRSSEGLPVSQECDKLTLNQSRITRGSLTLLDRVSSPLASPSDDHASHSAHCDKEGNVKIGDCARHSGWSSYTPAAMP